MQEASTTCQPPHHGNDDSADEGFAAEESSADRLRHGEAATTAGRQSRPIDRLLLRRNTVDCVESAAAAQVDNSGNPPSSLTNISKFLSQSERRHLERRTNSPHGLRAAKPEYRPLSSLLLHPRGHCHHRANHHHHHHHHHHHKNRHRVASTSATVAPAELGPLSHARSGDAHFRSLALGLENIFRKPDSLGRPQGACCVSKDGGSSSV